MIEPDEQQQGGEPEGFVNRFELQIIAALDVVPAESEPESDEER